MELSQTYISAIVILLSAVFQLLKVQVAPGDLNTFVLVGIQLVGGIIVLIRRYKKGDINALGLIK